METINNPLFSASQFLVPHQINDRNMRPDESQAPSSVGTVLAHVGQEFILRLGPVDGCNSTGISEAPHSILCKVCRVKLSCLVLCDIVGLVDARIVEYRLGQVRVQHFADNTTHEQVRFLVDVLDVGNLFMPVNIGLPVDEGHGAVRVVSRAGDELWLVSAFDLGRDDDSVVG